MEKNLDVVVYGATGFTGQLIAKYLQSAYHDSDLKWGISGRNGHKLETVKQSLGINSDIPTIIADSNEAASLAELAQTTKVVIAAAGPYQLYGESLIAACVEAGTDYVDLCGEPTWMRQMIDKYGEAAKASGANIVHSCGFDSIPSDLGIWKLQQLAKTQFGKPLSRVKGRVEAMQGGPSGGTVASFMVSKQSAAKDPTLGALMFDPFALTPGQRGAEQPNGNQPRFDKDLNSWATPFVMAIINTKNVHRTNALLGYPYGEGFRYDEMIATGPGDKGEQIANALAKGDGLVGGGDAPKPGEGPSPEEQESGFFTLGFHGFDDGNHLCVRVSGDKDPGYGCTSMMITEAALCLLEQGDTLKGGFWTPASAMAAPLITRLEQKQVLSFK